MNNSSNSSRPILKLERSPLQTILDIVAIAGIVVSFILVIYNWRTLPEKIPVHFNFSGRVTSYGSKNTFWILSFSSVFSYFLLKIISRYPHTFNYPFPITAENAPAQYRIVLTMMYWLRAEMIWLFTLIQWQVIVAATSPSDPLNSVPWILLPGIAILGTIGSYFWKAFQAR